MKSDAFEFKWNAIMQIFDDLADWLSRLRAGLSAPDRAVDLSGDPLSHPDVQKMSQRELADLPFPRLHAQGARVSEHRRGTRTASQTVQAVRIGFVAHC